MLLTGGMVPDIASMNGIHTSYPPMAKVVLVQYSGVKLIANCTLQLCYHLCFTLYSTLAVQPRNRFKLKIKIMLPLLESRVGYCSLLYSRSVAYSRLLCPLHDITVPQATIDPYASGGHCKCVLDKCYPQHLENEFDLYLCCC